MMKTILQGFYTLLFPPICYICREREYDIHPYFCEECFSKLEFITPPVCTICGKPFPVKEQEDHRCMDCYNEKRYYNSARALLYYEGDVMVGILRFKYKKEIHLARVFGWLLYAEGKRLYDFRNYDVIIPLPIHKNRLRVREFNQSALLAQELGKRTKIEVDLFSLIRIVDTLSQTAIKREERLKNVRGAFNTVYPERIKNKRILLIDDVLTTTASVNEASRALLKAGAKCVDVLAIARSRESSQEKLIKPGAKDASVVKV